MRRRIIATTPAVLLAASGLASAATSYWDANGTTAGSGGPTPVGTWGVDAFWSTASDGTAATAAWTPGDNAVFSAGTDATGAFTVTVSGTQSVGGITFEEGTLTLAGGTLSLVAGTSPIVVTAPGTTTISSTISGGGTIGLVKTGTGTLTLAGVNSYTTGTTVSSGTLRLGTNGALPVLPLTVAGTFDLNGFNQTVSSLTVGDGIATNAANVIGAGTLTVNGDIVYKSKPTNQSAPATIASNISLAAGTRNLTNVAGQISNDVYDLVITGVISGSGSLNKAGSDNFLAVLTQPNTYTGTTTVSNGILYLAATNCVPANSAVTVNSGAALSASPDFTFPGVTVGSYNQSFAQLSGAGNVLIGSATITVGSNGSSSTLSGGISDNALGGKLIKVGVGILTLSGGNDFRGGTTINAGTLQIGAGAGTGTIIGNIANNAALIFNRSDSSTYPGTISGTGGVTKTGAGLLVFTSSNTYTGTTTMTGGVLRAVDGTQLPNPLLTLGGGVYEPTTATFTRALGTGNGNVRLQQGSSGFSAFGTPLVVDIGGNGTGTGPAMTWGSTNFQPSSLVLNASTATASLEFKNAIDLAAGSRTVTVSTNTATLSGIISGSGASNLVKNGTGTLLLRNNANSYAGTTTVSAGILNITADSQLGPVPGAPTAGELAVNASTLQIGADLAIHPNRGISLGAGTATFDTQTFNLTYGGVMAGAGNLVKIGSGTLTLAGNASTYTGLTTVSAGILNIAGDLSLGTPPSVVTTGKLILNGATLQAAAGMTLHVNRGVSLGVNNGTIDTQAFNVTVSGAVSGTGSLTKLGAGTLALINNSGSYFGTTTVNAGTLAIAGDGSLGAIPAAPTSGEVTLANATTLQAAANASVHVNRGLTLGGSGASIDTNGFNLTWAGDIAGTGNLTKTGSGVLALTDTANSYTGTTTVTGGTLAIVADASLGTVGPAPLTLGGATTLRADASFTFAANRVLSITGVGGATINLNGAAGAAAVTFSGPITGTGPLNVLGPGTLLLRNASNGYTNGTVVTNATLNVTSDAQLGAPPGSPSVNNIVLSGGTFQAGASFTINANRGMAIIGGVPPPSTIDTQAFSVTYGGVIGGGGSLIKAGAGTLVLRGANTYAGSTTINAGTLNIIADAQLGEVPAAPTPGEIVLNGGTLQAAADLTIDANRGMTVSGATTSTIDTGLFNVTCAGAIAGTGALAKISAGTLTLATNNSGFSGPLAISNGTVLAGASSSLGNAAASNTLTIGSQGSLLATGPIVGDTRDVFTSGVLATINTAGFDCAFGNVSGLGNSAFNKAGAGKLSVKSVRLNGSNATLGINQGVLALAPNGGAAGVSVFNSLNILAAQLDLGDNHLIDHASGVGTLNGSNYTGLSAFIQAGRNGAPGLGMWAGNGIVTSQTDATSGNYTSIGVATASQVKSIAATATAMWAGNTVTGSDTLVMYTYGGDSNLDGKINVDDYGHIDSSIPIGLVGWFNGDFNYDGKINVDDYGIIDFNIGIQGAPFFAGAGAGDSSALSVTAVPEPGASIGIVGGVWLVSRRRRRRR